MCENFHLSPTGLTRHTRHADHATTNLQVTALHTDLSGAPHEQAATGMCYTTGFSWAQVPKLCALVHDTGEYTTKATGRPPALGLYRAVVATLFLLRRARVQRELAEDFEVSQPAISWVIASTLR